ncbi:F-box only protein 42 [Bulinus truncatus]|nr:F-box only protein 42 [Bulinus truncatus]
MYLKSSESVTLIVFYQCALIRIILIMMDRTDAEDIGEPSGASIVEFEWGMFAPLHEGSSCQLIPKMFTLKDMPEEILEHILGFLSPYRDMDAAKLVSKQWHRIIKSVVNQRKRRFYHKLSNGEVSWTVLSKDNMNYRNVERPYVSCISERHSHSAVYFDGSMYIFGGCTSTNTTFNDLWKFDLTSRQWIRPVAMGTYPSPKACATMVVYRGNLVLFGGWSHPIPYPNPHQSAHFFSELHIYSPSTNRWSHILSIGQEPEALGGHSASVAGHLMVIFGGSPRTGVGTNNLWVFNFQKLSWKLQPVMFDVKPEPRYGQYQSTLDDSHILIMGGSVGQNRVYNDVWLLTIHATDPWTWTKITVEHPELAAPQSWCHAACRVNNVIAVIAKSNKQRQMRNIMKRITKPRPSQVSASSSCSCYAKDSSSVALNGAACSEEKKDVPHLTSELKSKCQHHDLPKQHECADNFSDLRKRTESSSSSDEEKGSNLPNKNLLALQQRLHRECVNLPDPDNHHHNPTSCDKDDNEGGFHRLNNRWGNDPQAQVSHHPHQHHQQPSDQPQHGSFHRGIARGRGSGHMPSIRPNATSNRQKQLEALLRQEEILRNKSRALAAARNKRPQMACSDGLEVDETLPDIITSRNKMDIHVLDISHVLTDQVVEWKLLSPLQPVGAPTETICCSLLEGRSELLLFGGVVRDMNSPVSTNTAINKLYILQAS